MTYNVFGGTLSLTQSINLDSPLHYHWHHQDLLRGGAKLEIMSRGTPGELQGRVQQLLND